MIAGLFFRADVTLDILWFILIPVLPLTFMINPGMWRGICPLATANMIGSSSASATREVSGPWLHRVAGVGILLLFVLVPARRFLFNSDGPILALVVLAVTAHRRHGLQNQTRRGVGWRQDHAIGHHVARYLDEVSAAG